MLQNAQEGELGERVGSWVGEVKGQEELLPGGILHGENVSIMSPAGRRVG